MSFAKVAVASLALFAAPSEAVQPNRLRGAGSQATLAMHLWRQDCGRPSGLSVSLAQTNNNNNKKIPGAGMTPESIEPFTTVLKDGFYEVDCVKDYLFEYGDKFGDNKFSYKLGEISNVSIVHYSSLVAKEDQEQMTHEVCFRFCRTVPDMTFFGLTNGRECYCAPYYEMEASDSSDCDAVCDGDHTTMCGGKTKSSIFAMHQCSSTAADLEKTGATITEAEEALGMAVVAASPTWSGMVAATTELQGKFGESGDPGASDLMQTAKVYSGTLEEALGRATALKDKLTSLKSETSSSATGDLTSSSSVTAAEELMELSEAAVTEAQATTEEIEALVKADMAVRNDSLVENASKQYFSTMYFVNTNFTEVPSTCTGKASESPILTSLDGCARACDNDVHECTAFSYFPAGEGTDGLCFLMSKLLTIQYYTGCSETPAKLFQCYAKLSKYESTSIAPDGSGKCENCLKEAKKADRCV
mmetsp:Transcript_43348/g.92811  ORF Transcript_43348/g.92811 Transcript_43348/m.92811 type:complete len:474 (-) Transcript_43348:214-1635(-)|eukprot:CAMPEP_0206452220 /NCGR_PEP_ID=MMETSP0324_2-20121206/19822_1 /ASSEMBLY_ACC=CAM_ASM_000836 /TAXON_ID=2866 /ORGANISM="Crypthecodinium cohnii, Strain Seligo" /LENGTH=473 /DNA_ID=CAMNT_0053922281 /DNA_START=200 /DNA_END=1621 /DNA_ORIENTATION=+